MKTERELPRPGTAPLPPLPPPIGAHRPKPPVSNSLAPPAPPTSGRSPQASANPLPSVQLGSAGFEQRNNKRAKGAALGVVLILVAVLAVGIVYLVKSVAGTTTINNVATGDCLADFFPTNEDGESEIFLVKTVECTEPHAMEVYAAIDSAYEGMTIFPGQDEAFAIGQGHCLDHFELFTGVPAAESPYEMWTLVPVPQSWERGDRTIQCLIGSFDEVTLVEGTLQNSGRGF